MQNFRGGLKDRYIRIYLGTGPLVKRATVAQLSLWLMKRQPPQLLTRINVFPLEQSVWLPFHQPKGYDFNHQNPA